MQPRVSTRYQLSKDVILKASYTKMSQYVHLLSSMPIAMPTDLWVPVTKKIKPMRSHQYSLGGYYTGIKGWEFSVEGYYKDMYNVLEYKDGVSFFGSSTGWESKVEMGKGRSMGIEFMAQKTLGNSTGSSCVKHPRGTDVNTFAEFMVESQINNMAPIIFVWKSLSIVDSTFSKFAVAFG